MSSSLFCRMVTPPGGHSFPAALLKREGSAGNSDLVSNDKSTTFWEVVNGLRVIVPPAMPVAVEIGRVGRRCEGICKRKRKVFQIVISDSLVAPHAIDVLQHEWAHALAWNMIDDHLRQRRWLTAKTFHWLSHSPEWGVAFRKTYHAVNTEIYPALQAGKNFIPRQPRRHK